MGYPEARIRDPGDNAWSYSPYEDSKKLAGIVAWDYERSGLRPMMIGHSQGGMQAVKVLHELNGEFDESLRVFDPKLDRFEERTTHRRSDHAQGAARRRRVGRLCLGGRSRRRGVPAAEPMVDARQARFRSEYRR